MLGPFLGIGKPRKTIAEFRVNYLFYPFRYYKITLGNWALKQKHEIAKNFSDETATILALDEEYLHWVLERNIGRKASRGWDKLDWQLKTYLHQQGEPQWT